jgi:acetylornithine/succinyldiaminopimelate/putrescine aminotransferase
MSNAPSNTPKASPAALQVPPKRAPADSPPLFDVLELFRRRQGENYSLHSQYINPSWARVARLIGYDKIYRRAEGCWLTDDDGNRYLDLVSGFCVSNIGHNHPTVREALRQLLSEPLPNLIQLDCSLLAGVLAEELIRRIPWLEMVFFGNSGSEAIEAALKFARCATGRHRILHADGSYHGVTYGALSVTGHPMWREGFGPLLEDVGSVVFGDVSSLERELSRGDVAGVILEPIQVGAGIIVPPDDYFPKVQRLCRRHGALLVFDEVHTGFGRTGTFLAAEHWKVEPDIVCLSKGLSGGLVPVSAVVTRRKIMTSVFSRLDRCKVHVSTFGRNNLAMAAALAALHVLDAENLLVRCREMGDALRASLQPFRDRFELVKDIRGKGLLIGVEFGEPKSPFLRQAWSLMHRLNPGLFGQAFTLPLMERHRMLTQVAGHNEDVLKIAPALVIGRSEISLFTAALEETLAAAHRFPGPFWEAGIRLLKNAL